MFMHHQMHSSICFYLKESCRFNTIQRPYIANLSHTCAKSNNETHSFHIEMKKKNKEKELTESVSYSFRLYNGTACHVVFSLSSEHFECVKHTAMLQITTFIFIQMNIEQVHLFHTIMIVSICKELTKKAKKKCRYSNGLWLFGSF